MVWDWERRDPPRRVGGGPELEEKLEAEGPPASPPQRGSGLPGCPPPQGGRAFWTACLAIFKLAAWPSLICPQDPSGRCPPRRVEGWLWEAQVG